MIAVTKDWNPNQKMLAQLLKKAETFSDAKDLCKSMHKELHDIIKNNEKNIYQELLNGLTPENIVFRPENHFSSIAWNLWHITRIEDAIANILIADTQQVLSKEWMERINTKISDTGNAFSKIDVDKFDKHIDTKELFLYRKEVGKKTQTILNSITEADRKRKPSEKQLNRIIKEKVLTKEKDSIWLLEFWGNKTISGLLTMPITRHQMVHINDSFKLKQMYQKKYV